jgi:prepilin-type N-terminal cleavage/methylation domain-containing protein
VKTRSRSGFTLLELLLALAATALLAVSLYTCFSIAVRARDAAVADVVPVRTATVAMEMIRNDLEFAMVPDQMMTGGYISQSTSVSAPGFMGTPNGMTNVRQDQVDFYTIGPGMDTVDFPTRATGLKQVELAVETTPDGKTVLVRRVRYNLLPQQVQAEQPEEQIIARNVRSFGIRYSDGTPNIDPSSWVDTWDSTQQSNVLPAAAQVTLELVIPPQHGAPERIYRTVRVFPLPCHQDPNATTTSTGGGA